MTTVTHRAWLWGGSAIIASAIAEFAFPSILPGRGLISSLFLAAGLVLFAFGGGIRRNIFGGHALGAVSAVVLAALVVSTSVIELTPDNGGQGFNQVWVGSIIGFARFALTVVLVVEVGRNPRLPARWRWAPLWAVLVELVSWVAVQLVLVNANGAGTGVLLWVTSWAGLIAASVVIFVGVLGIVVAHRFGGSEEPASHPAAA